MMNIKVENNIPDIKITVNKNSDGEIIISLAEENENKRKLEDVQCGDTVRIGELEFIVIEQGVNTTAVLTKNSVKRMDFNGDGDWRNSDVRKFCNGEFFNELANIIGAENIINHTVKLMADDGTGKDLFCEDMVSTLTTDQYRRYREYIHATGHSLWTATRVTHDEETEYTHDVCIINANGILSWGKYDWGYNVHPFCILNSSVLVH